MSNSLQADEIDAPLDLKWEWWGAYQGSDGVFYAARLPDGRRAWVIADRRHEGYAVQFSDGWFMDGFLEPERACDWVDELYAERAALAREQVGEAA
jgi:hypothetical protein